MLTINKHHRRRLIIIVIFTVIITLACGLILFALKQNINVFLTPHEISAHKPSMNSSFRLGGMVKMGSVKRGKKALEVNFIVTDFQNDIPVHYVGILPDLFREGKGVIAEGQMNNKGIFNATMVLAKHDENYMPPSLTKKITVGQS